MHARVRYVLGTFILGAIFCFFMAIAAMAQDAPKCQFAPVADAIEFYRTHEKQFNIWHQHVGDNHDAYYVTTPEAPHKVGIVLVIDGCPLGNPETNSPLSIVDVTAKILGMIGESEIVLEEVPGFIPTIENAS